MMVVNRFRAGTGFEERVRPALELLRTKDGFVDAELGQNLDEPELWVLVTRWQNVGSYRRALSGMESKMTIVPLLSEAIDEPSAYDSPDQVGENRPRGA
ncbi:antibiotic biosynthesis monooxygenase [Enemella evansiae]|uniref:antibiotic biosynthesis monooxygenase family protein n=1 Tax=Enemella evansiae TaxID=2016499 RepID=UPI000B96637B|nr:antibiotic biosynthesis monooxygenase family protein [Enemella evansiae]OYN93448.1 antibiotic biosynthesis monooxygenase [Enemella evansiae]